MSPLAASRISSARHSSTGLRFLNVALTVPWQMLRRARSSRRDGATSTARGTEIPPNRRRVTSSRGAAFSRASTRTCTGFFCVRFSMISKALRTTRYDFGFSTAGASSPGIGSPGTSGVGAAPGAAGSGGGGRTSDSGGAGGGVSGSTGLPHRLLFASPDELVEAYSVHLDDLVSHPGDVPVRPAHAAADPFDQDLVVLVDEVDRAVAHGEGRHLPPVLDELDFHALAECRVRLLRLDRDLLEDDPLRLRGTLERVRFLFEVQHAPLVLSVLPPSRLAFAFQFARREETPCQRSTPVEGALKVMCYIRVASRRNHASAGRAMARSQYGHVTRSSGKYHVSTLPPQFGQVPTKCSCFTASWETNSSVVRSIAPLTRPSLRAFPRSFSVSKRVFPSRCAMTSIGIRRWDFSQFANSTTARSRRHCRTPTAIAMTPGMTVIGPHTYRKSGIS